MDFGRVASSALRSITQPRVSALEAPPTAPAGQGAPARQADVFEASGARGADWNLFQGGLTPPGVEDLFGGGLPDLLQPLTDPDGIRERAEQELQGSPTGQQALRDLERNGVRVTYGEPDGGSYFDAETNTIVIDPSLPPDQQALTLVHEANHAQSEHEGNEVPIDESSKDEYVDAQLDEEAAGTVEEIQANNELEQRGENAGDSEAERRYDDAVARERASNPDATPAELEAAGTRAVRQWFESEAQTSINGQDYPEYYGDAWDRANA